MRVRVEQARQDGGFRQIDDFRVRRNFHVRADGFNCFSAHQDDLIGFGGAFFRVDEFPGLDGVNALRPRHRVLRRKPRQYGCQE